MATYEIENLTSGVIFGQYEGETAEAAYLALAKDAGYGSIEEMVEVAGEAVIRITEV